MIRSYIEYHVDVTRLVWDSIAQISEEQFLEYDVHTQGSIRDHMIQITSIDRRWLAALKNQADIGHLEFEDYPTRAAARETFEGVAQEMEDYVRWLGEQELEGRPTNMPWRRWTMLLHIINQGTHQRALVLQRLAALGAPTVDHDFILWLRRE